MLRLLCLATVISLAVPPAAAQTDRAIAGETGVLRLDAVVEPERVLFLKSPIRGRITALHEAFADGGVLEENAVAVRIDPLPYEVALAEALSALSAAKLAYEQELAESTIARETVQTVDPDGSGLALRTLHVAHRKAVLDAAAATVALARQNLADTAIRPPFPAIVADEAAEKGAMVTPEDRLATLLATDNALIRVPVPASLRARLDKLVEATAPVTVEMADGTRRSGRLVGSEKAIELRTQTLFYRVRLEDPYDLSAEHGASIPFGAAVTVILGAAADG